MHVNEKPPAHLKRLHEYCGIRINDSIYAPFHTAGTLALRAYPQCELKTFTYNNLCAKKNGGNFLLVHQLVAPAAACRFRWAFGVLPRLPIGPGG